MSEALGEQTGAIANDFFGPNCGLVNNKPMLPRAEAC